MNLMDLVAIGKLYGYDDKGLWQDADIDNRINRDVLIVEILKDCASSEPLMNTFQSFKMISDGFFEKWKYQIGKLLDTQEFEYNPIWNKDGTTKYIKSNERDRVENVADDYGEENNREINSSTNNNVSADDNPEYQPHDNSITGTTDNDTIKSERNKDTKESEGFAENYTEIQQGNIGLTTTQTMIKEEQSLYEFNIYEWIVKKYRNELFLRVW